MSTGFGNDTSSLTLPARRESTFYGMPSGREATRRDAGHASPVSSSYFLRSTSSGLDSASSGGSAGTYATLRPSFLRTHRR